MSMTAEPCPACAEGRHADCCKDDDRCVCDVCWPPDYPRQQRCQHDRLYQECISECECGHPCNAHDDDNQRGCMAGFCACRQFRSAAV